MTEHTLLKVLIEPFRTPALLKVIQEAGFSGISVTTPMIHGVDPRYEALPRSELEFIVSNAEVSDIVQKIRAAFSSKSLRIIAVPAVIL
jgi:nitrogen regulatory protein PII